MTRLLLAYSSLSVIYIVALLNGVYADELGSPADHWGATDALGRVLPSIYTNTSGRNDILSARVVEGKEEVYFTVSTADDLTPHTDEHWMILLIDTDQKKESGWEGYELDVNRKAVSGTKSTCAKWIDGKWTVGGKVAMGYHGKHLEISVPNGFFPREPGQGFDFKWVDNVILTAVEALFLEGDVAPDRRFDFRY